MGGESDGDPGNGVLPPGTLLVLSPNLSLFEHMGEVYAYHDLFGYVLKMSRDVAMFLLAFGTPRTVEEVVADPRMTVERGQVPEFVAVLASQSCLVPPVTDETREVLDMYPVRGPWVLAYREAPDRVEVLTSRLGLTHGERLSGWQARLWDLVDGARTVRALHETLAAELPGGAGPSVDDVVAAVGRWVHHDRQFMRLSHHPLAAYRPVVFPMPPYLRSTMPFEPFDPHAAPEEPLASRRLLSASSHYHEDDRAPMERFDVDETTLSHLFREPHEALDGRTYATALVDLLAGRGAIRAEGTRILEIGAGTGAVAAGVIDEIARRWPDSIGRFGYTILDLSPELVRAQEGALAGRAVRVGHLVADAGGADLPASGFDLVLCNEMIGDLEVVRLAREEAAAILAGGEVEGVPGRVADLLRRHPAVLAGEHLPDEFRLNTGAFALLERIRDALAPGGWLFMSEFGEELRFPVLSDHLDHPEFSIHFGHLGTVASGLGLEMEYGEVLDLLGFRRDVEVLSTTRGQFIALRDLAARHGVRLEKLAYSRQALASALGDRLPLASVEGLRFDRVERRVMGLSPTDFKALLCRKPS